MTSHLSLPVVHGEGDACCNRETSRRHAIGHGASHTTQEGRRVSQHRTSLTWRRVRCYHAPRAARCRLTPLICLATTTAGRLNASSKEQYCACAQMSECIRHVLSTVMTSICISQRRSVSRVASPTALSRGIPMQRARRVITSSTGFYNPNDIRV